jgi:hypothetical protein
MMQGSENVSILDKTDWRKTIHKALEEAVLSIGTELFFFNVEQAAEAIKAKYPGWNASSEVEEMIERVARKHNLMAEKWILSHPTDWAYPWNRQINLIKWKHAMYLEILQNLKDIAGEHRMLLWGIKKLPTGSMSTGDNDVSSNEDDTGAI